MTRPSNSQKKNRIKEKENPPNGELCCPGRSQTETNRKWKERCLAKKYIVVYVGYVVIITSLNVVGK